MDKSRKKPSHIGGSLVGAFVAGLAFIPLVMSFWVISPYSDPLVLVLPTLVSWLPTVGLGALGGFVGSALAHKRFKRIGPWIGAVAGGLIAAMLIALLIASWLIFPYGRYPNY